MAPARKSPTTADGRSRAFQSIKKQAVFQCALAKRAIVQASPLPSSSSSNMDMDDSPLPSSSSSNMDLDDLEGTPLEGVPSRRPLTKLPNLDFYKDQSVSTGRKLPVSPKVSSARPTERSKPKTSGSLRKEVLQKEALRKAVLQKETPQKGPSSDPASKESSKDSDDDVIIIDDSADDDVIIIDDSADDDVFTIEDPDMKELAASRSPSVSSSASSSPALSTSSFGSIFRASGVKKGTRRTDYSDPTIPCFQCGGDRCLQMVAQRSGRCKSCADKFRRKRYVRKQVALGKMVVDKEVYEILAGPLIPLLA